MIKKNLFFATGVILTTFLFLVPRLILGLDSYIRIHDNLDGAKGPGLALILGDSADILSGIPIQIISILEYFLKPLQAYLLNDVIVHVIAFIGFFIFVKKHILHQKKDNLIIFGTSLCFAFLPFCSNYGISIAGLPLIFYAFLNLKNNDVSKTDYIIIILFPFYSYLPLTGIFILAVLGLVFAADVLSKRKINRHFFIGLVLLTLFYSISEINLIYNAFFSESFISHRSAWNPFSPMFITSFSESVFDIIKNFTIGQFHAASLHTPILLLSIILIFIVKDRKRLKPPILLLSVIFLFSVLYSMHYWYVYAIIKEKFSIFGAFNFGRFHWFHPFLWYVLLAYCLLIVKDFKYSVVLIPAILVIQMLYVVISPFGAKQELKYNIIRLFKKVEYAPRMMSYREFFSEELFKEIDNYLGEDKENYRIGCIGLQPAVAQYNGFYTLDGYMNNYPLEYKLRFRKIIAAELEKNPVNKMYFDDWGHRCYFFIHNLNKNKVYNIKTSNLGESEIDFNIKAFKEMGGKYFFSTVKITTAEKIGLKFLKTFEKDDLPWRIHLYMVNI